MLRAIRTTRRIPSIPALFAFAVGVAVSLQGFLNGRLGVHLGSPELAACISGLIASAGLAVAAGLTGAVGRARARMAAGARLRWWHLTVSANGALWMLVVTIAAPRVGLALVTVALVSGQTLGGLVLDRVGLSTAGRTHLTLGRVLGVTIAIAAVAIGAVGSSGEFRAGLLALLVITGVLYGVQQAGISQVTKATGEPLVAGLANVLVLTPILAAATVLTTGGSAPGGWSAPPLYWVGGGLLSVGIMIGVAVTVTALGVLRTILLMVAGQSLGGLLIDIVAPPEGETVTVFTIVSVVLVFVAVLVSNHRHTDRDRSPLALPQVAFPRARR